MIHKYTSVALENDAQEWQCKCILPQGWQCKYILHLTLLITFWQLWILYIERHLHKYSRYHHLQLCPDTHDRQNILSHFKLFKYWGGVDAGFHPQMCFMWSFYRLVFLFCDQLEKHATFYCSFAFVSYHNSNKERSSYLQELFIQWACFCRA